MLAFFSNSAPDGVNENLELTLTLVKKGLEFLLGDKNVSLILYLLLVLLPAKHGGIVEKNGGKGDLI